MKRAALTDVLLVGLKELCDATRGSPWRNERVPNIQIDNIEQYKKRQTASWEQQKQNRRKKTRWEKHMNMMTRIQVIEEGNREAMRQT